MLASRIRRTVQCFMLLGLVASTACAPLIHITRDIAPQLSLPGRHVFIHPYRATSGIAFFDLLAVFAPTPIDEQWSSYAAGQLNQTLLSKDTGYQVLLDCALPCPVADATFVVRIVRAEAKPNGEYMSGTAELDVTLISKERAVLATRAFRGDSYVKEGDAVKVAVDFAVAKIVSALVPETTVDSFVLAENGPLKTAAELAAKGELVAAEQSIREVLKQLPSDAAAHYHLGAVLTAKGALDEALVELTFAAQASPKYADQVAAARIRIEERDAFAAYRQMIQR